MDNPQHYQPLSHALHPPLTTSPHYSNLTATGSNQLESPHEEEEEEEDDDEGMVEEQLHEGDQELHHPESGDSSPAGEQEGERNSGCVFVSFFA